MDSGRFDDLARTMVSTSSRRVALPAMVGALVGLPGIAAAQDAGDGAGKPGRGGSSTFEVVEKPVKRLVQDDPDGDGGARASGKKKKKAKKQAIGLRQIWYWQETCRTQGTGGVLCQLSCPANMQAIGGGMYN
ncbi:MAG: hypothetical protein M3Z20_19835, partial [Chloroflexota bacterium]|nr:hypothetical protein [Chloroflexota bacterium]